jgi:hypothetical protein
MNRLFQKYKHLFLCVALVLSLSLGQSVFSQHEGHNMPGMSKPKPKTKVKRKGGSRKSRKKEPVARKRQPAKTHDMTNMPGMQTPAASAIPSAFPEKMDPHTQMPGMQMPASSPSPNPQAAPQKMDINAPVPAATPTASPHMHMPGMNMPAVIANASSFSGENGPAHAHAHAGSKSISR